MAAIATTSTACPPRTATSAPTARRSYRPPPAAPARWDWCCDSASTRG